MNRNFLLTAALALGLFACNDQNTPIKTIEKVAEQPGLNAGAEKFTIKTPVGWTRKDTSLSGVNVLFLYPPTTSMQSFHPNLNVITQEIDVPDLDKHLAAGIEGMKQSLPNFKVIETGDIEAGNLKGKWLHYTQSQNGTDLENIYYFFAKGGICYGVTSVTLKGGMERYRTAFESVVKTLEVK